MSSIMDSVRSIIVSARTKKDSTGPSSERRSRFGTVTPRYDAAGNLIAWQVRYPDPKRPGKKVQRQFKPDMEHEAHQWLEGERHLLELDRKNIQEWVHPSERRRRKRTSGSKGNGTWSNWTARTSRNGFTRPNAVAGSAPALSRSRIT